MEHDVSAKTAIKRRKLSKPLVNIIVNRPQLITEANSILDYGCGYGRDIDYLALKYPEKRVVGFDPNHRRMSNIKEHAVYDLGFLHYVLNILINPYERFKVLVAALRLCRALSVSIRTDNIKGEIWSDGVITNIGTFQKQMNVDEVIDLYDKIEGTEVETGSTKLSNNQVLLVSPFN